MDGDGAADHRLGDVVGTIRHRLLINRWVDPAEVGPRLPAGLRPLIGPSGGVVVGCCLIAIESARPWPLPGSVGPSIRAAAHRISVEAGPVDAPIRAVYVPARHTDSIPAVVAGGRVFPGVHRRSTVESTCDRDRVSWSVRPADERDGRGEAGDGFSIRAAARRLDARAGVEAGAGAGVRVGVGVGAGVGATRSEVADIVIGAELGLSPDNGGRLEAADLVPFDRACEEVELTELDSAFLDGFRTAAPAETVLMTDVGFRWRRAAAPGGIDGPRPRATPSATPPAADASSPGR